MCVAWIRSCSVAVLLRRCAGRGGGNPAAYPLFRFATRQGPDLPRPDDKYESKRRAKIVDVVGDWVSLDILRIWL